MCDNSTTQDNTWTFSTENAVGIFLDGVLCRVQGSGRTNKNINAIGKQMAALTYPILLEISSSSSQRDLSLKSTASASTPSSSLVGTISLLSNVRYPRLGGLVHGDGDKENENKFRSTLQLFIEGWEMTSITEHSSGENHIEHTRRQKRAFLRHQITVKDLPIVTIVKSKTPYSFPISIPSATHKNIKDNDHQSLLPSTMRAVAVQESVLGRSGSCEISYKLQAFIEVCKVENCKKREGDNNYFTNKANNNNIIRSNSNRMSQQTKNEAITIAKFVSSIISPYIRPSTRRSRQLQSSVATDNSVLTMKVGETIRIPQMAMCGLFEIGYSDTYDLNLVTTDPRNTNNTIHVHPGQKLSIRLIEGIRHSDSVSNGVGGGGSTSGGLLDTFLSKNTNNRTPGVVFFSSSSKTSPTIAMSIKVKFVQRISCSAYDLQVRNHYQSWEVSPIHIRIVQGLGLNTSKRRDNCTCHINASSLRLGGGGAVITTGSINVPGHLKDTYENGNLIQVSHEMLVYIVEQNNARVGGKEKVIATSPILKVIVGS